MSVDVIGNFLTIIRNGVMASKPWIVAPYSKVKLDLAAILKDEGFIRDFHVVESDSVKKEIKVFLKYVNGESVIHEIKRISKPGRRDYVGAKAIRPVIGGLGLSILTTSHGVISNRKAKELGVGGEVLCTVW
ncbi:30S ribosomal protein S8 [Candidatus Dependentiae bacterium Noda2021]|nr:30S ribosomal protein S8 [Candidatus Dependentiae bacterium Noda2021]